jgi:tetratricopeptide (TPR) repeat protein
MRVTPRLSFPVLRFGWLTAIVALGAVPCLGQGLDQGLGQAAACPAVSGHSDTPARVAYREGHYSHAEDLYGQALNQHPGDLLLSAEMVQTLLLEGEISRASSQVDKMLAGEPHSAVSLTALAEVQLRKGEPWLAMETLKAAAAADPCYARTHLIRSRALGIDSMYATERAEIQSAYDIDPADPDIRHAWLSIVSPANEIQGIDEGLATMKDLDGETRTKAQETMRSMLPLLTENSQTCKVLPSVESAMLPLLPLYLDPKHVDGYRLEVQLPQGKAKLQVDTAASGIYITRALAEQNGLLAGPNDPQGTVHADSVHIGPLEFRDCTIGVSEAPFAGKADGFIGTDIFDSYLITLNQPQAKLVLSPLPRRAGVLPGDRFPAPELDDFTPVYHRQQFLLVPVMLNNKTRKLFVLDTGIRFSTMTSEVAHSVSTTKVNFTNSVQTVSGSTLQVYRDSFNLRFADLALEHQTHILEFDPSAIDQHAGIQIAGMLGFDMLHSLVLHLDYRDGLVKLESSDTEPSPGRTNATVAASADAEEKMECPRFEDRDLPTDTTIEATVVSLLDSGHLKPGKEVQAKILHDWQSAQCTLVAGSYLYGHVTASERSKAADGSKLAIVFDHGECYGRPRSEMSLKIIGLVAPPDQYVGLHGVLPAEVAGRGRQISRQIVGEYDDNLNPGGPPHTVHPGIVAGLPKIKLDPVGGPACSAILTSTEPSVRLWSGSEFILTMLVGQ